jgi:hypothetical protein
MQGAGHSIYPGNKMPGRLAGMSPHWGVRHGPRALHVWLHKTSMIVIQGFGGRIFRPYRVPKIPILRVTKEGAIFRFDGNSILAL